MDIKKAFHTAEVRKASYILYVRLNAYPITSAYSTKSDANNNMQVRQIIHLL